MTDTERHVSSVLASSYAPDTLDDALARECYNTLRPWWARIEKYRETSGYVRDIRRASVENVAMNLDEQRAAWDLYGMTVRLTAGIVSDLFEAYTASSFDDRPSVEVSDVLQETWDLFLRALSTYDSSKSRLTTHLHRQIRRDVQVYLKSQLTTPACDDQPEPAALQAGGIEIDYSGLAERLAQSSADAMRIWIALSKAA